MEKVKRSHKKPIIILIIVAALIAAPFVPSIVCDIRTAIHGGEFEDVLSHRQLPIIEDKSIRVLRYDGDSATLYYWGPGQSGITVSLERSGDHWTATDYNVVWQRYGSAHSVVPEYWFHFFYFINQRTVP